MRAACLSAPDCPDDRGAGEESPLRDDEPSGIVVGNRQTRIVDFTQYQIEMLALFDCWKRWQSLRGTLTARPKAENIKS